MKKRGFIKGSALLFVVMVFFWGVDLGHAQSANKNSKEFKYKGKITHSERKAAAERAAADGFKLPVVGAAAMAMPGDAPHYFSHPNYANSPLPEPDGGGGVIPGTGIRKFVDGLPGLGPDAANNLGQFIPVAVPDTVSYPGSDYYEIALVQYREQMHSDLPGTLLRGYVQLSTGVVPGGQVPLANELLDGTTAPIAGYTGVTPPHYLGTTIVATKNRPVRILFRNLLPAGVGGDLFIPTDVTVMGAGMGPNMGGMQEPDPQNPMCGMVPKPLNCFTENRATLHLHGGISPWISDGTPHQWTTPATENTPYTDGVSVQNVPDMPDPGPGAITFFYTNQQSARLMFYHDHAWGITRLNVYAGEAAPYIISDQAEQSLITGGIIPGAGDTIPLVVQDKTFVPSMEQLAVSDELWDMTRWGGEGNLWLPHVYSPAQNPGDSSGVNQFGRWAYGPWFWPPTTVDHPPIANAYYDPNCDPDVQWCEPPMMPSTPFNSMGMEAFHDTPVVNGTAYPTVTVQPKSYRLRFLNAASDRFFNLSLYVADASGTEVALNAAEVEAALTDPAGVFPTPDTALSPPGPNWIQIGTEGGFLPAPVVIPPQHITWVTDPTVFNAGNVDQHSLLIAPAERADVIVDFSAFAGRTLILYNDAPAAFPARDPRYDYYTGNADLRDTGGAPPTLLGYGPNTRTVMQIVVADSSPAAPFNMAALQTAFAHKADGTGVFESSQHPIIVGQGAYNSAYGASFKNSGFLDGFARITDYFLTFATLSGVQMNSFPFQQKAIQDEMGEAFEREYGRMSGNLGLEVPLTQAGVQQNLILYPYVNPASEVIDATSLPFAMDPNDPSYRVQPISEASDGTQIWKITHNGVDTHPIHFHLFDVQLLNRVGWDGIIRPPDANELGWKDTVRVSPLEDTIVALRPIIPVVPFEVPNSVRVLNPMMPLGSTLMFNSTDANGNPTAPIINDYVNFGLEYVWHCHILSHEEMDMMRPMSVALPPKAPSNLTAALTGSGSNRKVILNWTENSLNATSFTVQRATDSAFTAGLVTIPLGMVTTYEDPIGNTSQTFYYRVFASNTVGYTAIPGYASVTADSPFSETVAAGVNVARFISGTVQFGGVGLSGVTMTLTGTASATTTTASDGSYFFTGLANGTYTVSPGLSGYFFLPGSRTVAISDADVGGVDFSAVDISAWHSIPGMTANGPALAYNPSAGKMQMVVRASDGTLWASTFSSAGVFNNDWVNIPGTAADAPALAWNTGANKMQMVVRASNGTLWASTFSSAGVFNNDWVNIPGTVADAPALAWNTGANKMQMVARQGDSSLWMSSFSTAGVFNNDWASIPGMTSNTPALSWNAGAGKLQMVVRQADSSLWTSSFSATGVFNNDWASIPGMTSNAPALSWNAASSQLDLMVRASDSSMWHSTFGSGGLFNNDWANFIGATASAPEMAYMPSIGKTNLTVRAGDSSLWTILF